MKNYIDSLTLIFVTILIAGCGSPAMPTAAPTTEPALTTPLPTAPDTVGVGDTWWKTYRNSGSEVVHDVFITDDGGYYMGASLKL
jgi:hypothetical protein